MTKQNDPLERILRESNPLTEADGQWLDSKSKVHSRQWQRRRRRQRRRRVGLRIAVAASVVFLVIGGFVVTKSHEKRLAANKAHTDLGEPAAPNHDLMMHERKTTPKRPSTLAEKSAANDQNSLRDQRQGQLASFRTFVSKAGAYESVEWYEAVRLLVQTSSKVQRQIVSWVPEVPNEHERHRAMRLVCQAAGDSERGILIGWLESQPTRQQSWARLLEDRSLDQLKELVAFAQSDVEKRTLCRAIASLSHRIPLANSSALALADLSADPTWRPSVRDAAQLISSNSMDSLLMRLRSRDKQTRLTAGFVLASVPGNQLDHYLTSLVVNGRHRQPAYLALLSRSTQSGNAFLNRAAMDPSLRPAMYSAQLHFTHFQSELQHWISQSKEHSHEQSQFSKRAPILAMGIGRYHCGRRIGQPSYCSS
ncbi:MAG: hypothetical protein AAF802_18190 [Planctomycetota bacterium]